MNLSKRLNLKFFSVSRVDLLFTHSKLRLEESDQSSQVYCSQHVGDMQLDQLISTWSTEKQA